MDTARGTAAGAGRLLARAVVRRGDGSRGARAARAWRRLVRAVGDGDTDAQDAVRTRPGALPRADERDLLAVAPEDPAARAAFLALVGRHEQRRALDPEGRLLSLAYRGADDDTRRRLRTALVAAGDPAALRALVTGDTHEGVAALSAAEVLCLARRLAGRGSGDELRRLALGLPLRHAVAVAALLPPEHRTGGDRGVLGLLAAAAPDRIAAAVARAPQRPVTRLWAPGGGVGLGGAAFSPDAARLAVVASTIRPLRLDSLVEVHRFDLASGDRRRLLTRRLRDGVHVRGLIHLADDVLLHIGHHSRRGTYDEIVWAAPSHARAVHGRHLSTLRRSASGGAVGLDQDGVLVFADPGAARLRLAPRPLVDGDGRPFDGTDTLAGAFATLPGRGLVAVVGGDRLAVADEDGRPVAGARLERGAAEGESYPVVALLSPTRVAVRRRMAPRAFPRTEIWDLDGRPRCVERHEGQALERWPWDFWRRHPPVLDFALSLAGGPGGGGTDEDAPPLLAAPTDALRHPVALSAHGDLAAATPHGPVHQVLELHGPHLASARALLERPLPRMSPPDLHEVRQLLRSIGDPELRAALGLLERCLTYRFGRDVA
ncbi:hypothetical protein [Streptomyces sp. NPDC050560]|uniref:hypothetical protein n=1 Tax=Streptomyces sp. NPDC050560 TaxID=3365630 RepID=UPI0037B4C013